MKALEADGAGGLRTGEQPPVRASEDRCVVDIRAFGVNHGEIRRLQSAAAGWRPGWDFAGIVREAAEDGSGPPAGARVVGATAAGASWAEEAAVTPGRLAVLPDGVSFAVAATLPAAGLTALWCLELGGPPLGRRVLVTAATGAVGRFAVQFSRAAGATVTASVRSAARAEALGVVADEIVEGTAFVGPFDIVLDSVGGEHLVAGVLAAAPFGTVVSLGNTAGTPVVLDGDWAEPLVRIVRFRGSGVLGRREVTSPLGFMLAGVAGGQLDVGPIREVAWDPAGQPPDVTPDANGAKTIVVLP